MAGINADVAPSVAPSQGTGAYQRIDAPVDAFGGAGARTLQLVGQDIGRAAHNATETAIMLQERQNELAINDAFTSFQNSTLDITIGDPSDPTKKGYFSMQGREALDNARPTIDKIEGLRAQIRNGLQNDAQRLRFDTASRRLQSMNLERVATHAASEQRQDLVRTRVAAIDAAARSAGAYFNDDGQLDHNLADARSSAVKAVQDAQGMNADPLQVQQAVAAADIKVIGARIDRWATTDPVGALRWLENGTVFAPGSDGPAKPGEERKRIPVSEALGAHAYRHYYDPLRARVENAEVQGFAQEYTGRGGAAAAGGIAGPAAGGTPLTTVGWPSGLVTEGNINLNARPQVRNADGSVSTVRSMSIEEDGKHILIPTVVGNKVVSDEDAIKHYHATGQHLGIFDSADAATKYAKDVHEQQAAAMQRGSGPGAGVAPRLERSESGGSATTVNAGGYSGRYQIGAPLAADAGIYTPGRGETVTDGWSGAKWSGTFNIPGFPDVKTHAQFLANPEAQHAAYLAAQKKNDETAQSMGLYNAVGRTINGVEVTREGILAGMWLGGGKGVQRWVSSGGQDDPRDGNGTPVSKWVALGQGVGSAGGGEASPDTWQTPGITNASWDTQPAATGAPGTPRPTRNPQMFADEATMLRDAQAAAAQRFPNRPDLQHYAVQAVYQQIAQTNALQAKYEAEQAKALRDAQEAAGQRVVTTLLRDPKNFDPATITNDPTLTYEQKLHLTNAARLAMNRDAGGNSATYGAGFNGIYTRVTAPEGTLGRVTDAKQLWAAMASGELTPAGYEKVMTALVGRRTPEGEAINTLQHTLFARGLSEISTHRDDLQIRDPRGQELYGNFQFAVFQQIEAARAAGKSIMSLYDPKSPDYLGKLVAQFKRTPAQIMTDQIAAAKAMTAGGSEAGGAGATVDLTTQASIMSAWNRGRISAEAAEAALLKGGFIRAEPVVPVGVAPVVPQAPSLGNIVPSEPGGRVGPGPLPYAPAQLPSGPGNIVPH